MSFGDITTDFTALVNRRDFTANPTLVNNFLQKGILRIQRELRGPLNEKSIVASIGSSYNGLIIPGDYLELIRLEPMPANGDTSVFELSRVDVPTAKRMSLNIGSTMRVFARQGKKWWIGGPPNAGDQIRIDYYSDFTPLSAPTDENILTKVAPDLVTYAALTFAGENFTDKRLPEWQARYEQILESLQDQSETDELSSDAQVLPCYSFDDECF